MRSGGAEQRRGAAYQDWSLVFYILTRLTEYSDIEIFVESVEDATIVYNINDETSGKTVTEYVQCKKHEKKTDGSVHAGVSNQDHWIKDTFYIGELQEWIDAEREGVVTRDLIKADRNAFYTAVVFGYLQPKLERFVPKDLKDYLPILYSLPYFNKQFRPDHSHNEDPAPFANTKFGGEESRKRIRVVSTGSPQELKTMCWLMLTNAPFYAVSSHKADNVLNQVHSMISEASQVHGKILGSEIVALAHQARAERGIWQAAETLLRKEHDHPSDINRHSLLNWHDFEHQRYVKREVFDRTWNAVTEPGAFIVVSGAVGTGKTTLCLYLMYRFLKANSNHRAYYLNMLPTTVLTDEVEFLRTQIDTDTLFIVDDEQISVEEADSLIKRFWDYKTSAKARLVVSSKTNYGRTEALAAGRTTKELRQAIQVALPNNSIQTVEKLIAEIREKTDLKTLLSNRELASLSGGVLGEALLIARATQELTGSTMEDILNRKNLKKQIIEWILSYLPDLNGESDFVAKVAPIFVISAFALPVPLSYSPSIVKRLHLVGFLEEYDMAQSGDLYQASDTNLAFILQSQYKDAHFSILSDYIDRYPQWLPHTFNRMADWEESQKSLEDLSRAKLDLIIDNIKDPTSSLWLSDITSLIQSIRWAARGTATTIYRRWAMPFGQPNENFLPDIVARARNARELTKLLVLLLRLDNDVQIAVEMAESQLMPHEARTILFHLTQGSCQLDEAANCLHALRLYSKKFADELNETFRQTPHFKKQLENARSSDDGLFVLLRYCEQVKYLSRVDAYECVEQYLPKDRIVDATLHRLGNINPLSQFLLRLHRLYPIWAADVLTMVLSAHETKFKALLEQEDSLDTLSQELHSFSRVNRLAAIEISHKIVKHLMDLVRLERKYSIIGASVETIRKSVSATLARRVCDSLDEDNVLQLLLSERRYVDVIGKFLFLLTKASPEKAAWFEARLDYQFFIKVARTPRLRDAVILIRGFLAAASPERLEQLQQQILNDLSLIKLFKKRWQEANTLTEIAFCLVSLMESRLGEKKETRIRRGLGFDNAVELHLDIQTRFREADSLLHIANGLYGVAQYDLALARRVLREYTDALEGTEARKRDSTRPTQGHQKQGRTTRGNFGRDRNLVDLGCLFRIAAAVNSSDARRLLSLTIPSAWAQMAANEPDLGRLTVFILGLHQVSRHNALMVISSLCSEDHWRKQYEETEDLENLVHYVHCLNRIDAKRAAAFVDFLLEDYGTEIIESLRVEANILIISNWVRLLARSKSEHIEKHSASLATALQRAWKDETRLRHLLEACESLIEIGRFQEASDLCKYILNNGQSMGSIRDLRNWLIIINKSLYIEKRLGFNDLTAELTRSMYDLQLALMIASEAQVTLAAFAYQLFKSNSTPSLSQLRSSVLRHQKAIIEAANDDSDSTLKAVALILAEAPIDRIRKVVVDTDWLAASAWELGLVTLLIQAIFPDQADNLSLPLDTETPEFNKFLANGLKEHASNLEFALTLTLANQLQLNTKSNEQKKNIEARLGEESSSAIHWLLENYNNPKSLQGLSYYIWYYLKETILRPTYMPWTNNVEQLTDNVAFRQPYMRNISDLSSS